MRSASARLHCEAGGIATSAMAKAARKAPAPKPKAAPVQAPKKRKVAANAIDAIDEAAFAEKVVTKRRRRNLEEEVSKCLKDNFKGWTEAMTDLNIVDGRSLREQVAFDKEQLHQGVRKEPMGKYYYEWLRTKFGAGADPTSKLRIKDPSLPEDANLFDALRAIMQHCRDYAPVNAFLDTSQALDQKNLCALLKCCLKVSPLTSMDSLTFVLNVMRFLSRHSYKATHPDEVACMRAHFDSALCRSLNLWRNNERPVSEWWAASKHFAKIVLDEAKVDNIIKTAALDLILDDLASVCESCTTGSKMFSRAYCEAQFALVSSKLSSVLQQLDSLTIITAEAINQNKALFSKEVQLVGKSIAEAFKPKDKHFRYLGVDFTMPVSSIIDEYELRVAAKLRSIAVSSGTLEPLWCELQLAGPQTEARNVKVEYALVEQSAACRSACVDFMEGKDITGENIKSLFTNKFNFLRQMDKHFQVEMYYFLACVGERGNDRIKSGIQASLPAPSKPVSPRVALASLKALEDSKLFEFVGMGVRSILTSIRSMVESIANDRAPNFDTATDNAFFKAVKNSLLLFLVVNRPASSAEATATPAVSLTGTEALAYLFKEASDQRDAGTKIGLEQLRPLQTFGWALSEPERCAVVDWVKVAVSASRSVSSAADAAAKRQARNKSRPGAQNTDALVQSLFT